MLSTAYESVPRGWMKRMLGATRCLNGGVTCYFLRLGCASCSCSSSLFQITADSFARAPWHVCGWRRKDSGLEIWLKVGSETSMSRPAAI